HSELSTNELAPAFEEVGCIIGDLAAAIVDFPSFVDEVTAGIGQPVLALFGCTAKSPASIPAGSRGIEQSGESANGGPSKKPCHFGGVVVRVPHEENPFCDQHAQSPARRPISRVPVFVGSARGALCAFSLIF